MLAYIHDKLIELVLLHDLESVLGLCQAARHFARTRHREVERYVFTNEEGERLMRELYDPRLERLDTESHRYEFRAERVMGAPFTVCGLTTYDEIRMGYRPWGERRRLFSRERGQSIPPPMSSYAWWETVQAFERARHIQIAGTVKRKVEPEAPQRPPSKLHPLVQLDEALQQLGHAEEDP